MTLRRHLLALAVGLPTFAPAHADTALVLSQSAAKLTAIDCDTDRIVGELALDKAPAAIAIAPNGEVAYVTHPDLANVTVVDLVSWKIKAKLPTPGTPFGVVVAPTGALFVGDWNGVNVYEIDPTDGAVLKSAQAGNAPAHLALTPDGRTLLAVARESNTLTAFDTRSLAFKSVMSLERAPFALAVSRSGTHAIVANAQAGSASIVDLATLKVTDSKRVGAMPYGVAYAGEDKVLVANQQSGTVSALDLRAQGDPPVVKVGSYPEGIAVTADGHKAYVANWFSDDVSVIDIATLREVARIKAPSGPRGVAIAPGRRSP